MGQMYFRLDEESRIVVENGFSTHQVRSFGIEFRSEDGLLNFGSAAPFERAFDDPTSNYIVLLSNPWEAFAFGRSTVFDVTYDGDPASGDLSLGMDDAAVGHPLSARFRPADAFLDVGMTDEQQWAVQGLHGRQARLSSLRFSSASGSLVPATTAEPFAELLENTSSVIHYRSPDGAVTIDDVVTLDSGWDLFGSGTRDVRYEFTDAEGFQVDGVFWRYTGPSVAPLGFRIADELQNEIEITGSGQQLTHLDIYSRSGSLIPGDDGSPLDDPDSQSPTNFVFQIDGPVTIDGSVNTGVQYSTNVGGEDVRIKYELFGNSGREYVDHIHDYPTDPAVPSDPIDPIGVSIDGEFNSRLLGDSNLDGEVNFLDFLVLAEHFGQAGGWAEGDFNGDGELDFLDFLDLANNFGESAPAVPEPTTSLMGVFGILGLIGFRKRR